MRITLATSAGIADLGVDGHLSWRIKGNARVFDGEWAIVDGAVTATGTTTTTISVEPAPLCLAAVGDDLLIGTASARLFRITDGASAVPVDSFDGIPTRDSWYTPWGGPPDTRSLTVDPSGTVFVNVHVGGVWRVGDDEGEWAEVVDRDADTHQVLARGTTIAVAAAVGFGQSDDGGRSFRWTTAGLHDTYCRAVAVAGDTVLLTASGGPRSRQGAVYHRPIDAHDDTPFEKCHDGLPEWFPGNIDTFQLAASGRDAVVATADGQVFVSTDAGGSWDLVATGLDAIHAVAIS